jgi:hypothetical protein
MKRALCVFFAVLLLLMIPLNAALAASTSCTLKITVTAKRISNNHVGNSWAVYADVNGTTIKKGKSATLKCGDTDTVSIVCTAIENDKIPDVGRATINVDVATLKKGNNKFTQTVVVTETAGRYSGNTAEWAFTVTVNKKAA